MTQNFVFKTKPAALQTVAGTVLAGTGMASGVRGCQEIGGSVRAQRPFFEQAGLDMLGIYNGTINIDLSPYSFNILAPDLVVRSVKWHPEWPAEDFSFVNCEVEYNGTRYDGYVYYPHPETKPTEFMGRGYVEVLTRKIPDLEYGHSISFVFDEEKMTIG